MFLSKLFSKWFTLSKSSEIILPTEVWIHIWSFLDFKILQKICTLVSKGWLHDIRNSTRLSGELILRVCKYGGVSDINGALSRWPKLKVLHLSNCSCNYNRCNCISFQLSKLASHWETSNELTCPVDREMLEINLTEHALLKKISWKSPRFSVTLKTGSREIWKRD